jgi:hypothetical protein
MFFLVTSSQSDATAATGSSFRCYTVSGARSRRPYAINSRSRVSSNWRSWTSVGLLCPGVGRFVTRANYHDRDRYTGLESLAKWR